MSQRSCSGYYSLPSRYSPNGGFQYGSDSGRQSPLWTTRDLGCSRAGPELSRPLILSELERNAEECYMSPRHPVRAEVQSRPSTGYSEPDYSSNPWKEYRRGSHSPPQQDRSRSVSPMRGIHSFDSGSFLFNGGEPGRKSPSPPARRRRHSLSRLPHCPPEEAGYTQPLAQRGRSESELDLRASLSESAQRRADLVERLRGAHERLEGQSGEIAKRDKELELNRAKMELLALKQKQLEGSIAQLEKEKGWLEQSRYEEKKQRGELQDRIINLELEVMKAKVSLDNLSYETISPNNVRSASLGKDELSRDLRTVRDNLHYYRNRAKVLEAERDEATRQLNLIKEGQQLAFTQTQEANQRVTESLQAHKDLHEELGELRTSYSNTSLEKELLASKAVRLEEKVADLSMRLKSAVSDRERFLQEKVELHQRAQELALELERAKRGREGFNDQVSDLHVELVGAKAQANRQDQEKVHMKEELVMYKQVHEKLSSELRQTKKKLETTLDQLHQLEAEKKIFANQVSALEMERAQLLGEKEVLMSVVEGDTPGHSQANNLESLAQQCEDLRMCQAQLEEEKEALQTRCEELRATQQQKQAEMVSQLQDQQQVAQYWKDRWQQAAVELKTKQGELEEVHKKHSDTMNKGLDSKGLEAELESLRREAKANQTKMKELEKQKEELEPEVRKLKKMMGGSSLQRELENCKHELELERGRVVALQYQVQMLQSRTSGNDALPRQSDPEAPALTGNASGTASESLESKDWQAETDGLQKQLVKERQALLEKEELIWTLKEEIEELRQKKPGDIKFTECSTEKLRLEQLVESLEQQLAERDQALRHLKQLREMEKTEMEIKVSSLALKLAQSDDLTERESRGSRTMSPASSGLWTPKKVQTSGHQKKEEADVGTKCSRCETFLEKLNKMIDDCKARGGDLQEEKNQALTGLSQLQEILKGLTEHARLDEQVLDTLQSDNERLRRQHQMVTEQLKGLFKEKQKLAKAYEKLPREQKGEGSTEEMMKKSRVARNVMEAVGSEEKQYAKLEAEVQRLQEELRWKQSPDGGESEMQNMRSQLGQKMETISAMANEIKTLREKNESLMKAKLRFQQQVQHIRSISDQGKKRDTPEPFVPRLTSGSDAESTINLPSYGSEPSSLGSRRSSLPDQATQFQEMQMVTSNARQQNSANIQREGWRPLRYSPDGSRTESEQPTPENSRPSTPLNLRTTPPPPLSRQKPSSSTSSVKTLKGPSPDISLLSPRSQGESVESGETLISTTPSLSALLSPRPYRQQQPHTFKFGDNHNHPAK
ncbi:myosin heavy chain, cardiac muscle isoform-like isoform X2 [Ambystoma mexicanum]|uniref:myosin heavy chain, cardiac muscle isoform-like isoform X2 n=1 Tax=Ambystoma mexicanum TaxID=8296 RepID=UPI0037E8B5F6